MDQHFHELLVLQEEDVGSSADPGVQVLLLDFEVDVQSEQHLGLEAAQDVLGRLYVSKNRDGKSVQSRTL